MAVFIIATVGVACPGFFLLTSVIGESTTLYVYLAAGLGWSGGGDDGVVRRRGAATALEGVRFGVLIEDIVIPCCFLLAKLLLLNCSYGFLSGARKKLCQNGIKTIWTWSSFRVNHATANLK